MWVGLSLLFIYRLLLTFARGTCLGASLVCIAVCTAADDSPISDEIGPVAEGVCKFVALDLLLLLSQQWMEVLNASKTVKRNKYLLLLLPSSMRRSFGLRKYIMKVMRVNMLPPAEVLTTTFCSSFQFRFNQMYRIKYFLHQNSIFKMDLL